MTVDPLNPREGDRFTCPRGEVRIDRVADGWVYFVQWPGDAETGAPTRMEIDEWRASVAEYGLVAKEEPRAEGLSEAELCRINAAVLAWRDSPPEIMGLIGRAVGELVALRKECERLRADYRTAEELAGVLALTTVDLREAEERADRAEAALAARATGGADEAFLSKWGDAILDLLCDARGVSHGDAMNLVRALLADLGTAPAPPRPLTVLQALSLPEVRSGEKWIRYNARAIDATVRCFGQWQSFQVRTAATPRQRWSGFVPEAADLDAECRLIPAEVAP